MKGLRDSFAENRNGMIIIQYNTYCTWYFFSAGKGIYTRFTHSSKSDQAEFNFLAIGSPHIKSIK